MTHSHRSPGPDGGLGLSHFKTEIYVATAIPADAQERFHRYLQSTEAYNAKIIAEGDNPWHKGDIDARRELFMRRYQRPAPPAGLGIPDIKRPAHQLKPARITAEPASHIWDGDTLRPQLYPEPLSTPTPIDDEPPLTAVA
ncbi:hypothetical protein [Mycobacterium marinum]|uniref:hypothetical protein n=1 Tax=Mycobacterium marinum TaxID=1781 RepID=UPI0035691DA7